MDNTGFRKPFSCFKMDFVYNPPHMVVRMRSTRSHTGNRRSHHALKSRGLLVCENCKAPKEKHAVCAQCGTYKGRKVIDMEAALKKETKKSQNKNA